MSDLVLYVLFVPSYTLKERGDTTSRKEGTTYEICISTAAAMWRLIYD